MNLVKKVRSARSPVRALFLAVAVLLVLSSLWYLNPDGAEAKLIMLSQKRRPVGPSTAYQLRSNPSAPEHSTTPSPRFVLISFADRISIGPMWGATARSCYANMHGYHSVLYNEKDLIGYAKTDRDGLPTSEVLRRAMYWSKLSFIELTFERFNLTYDRDWVFWADADTTLTNPEIKLEKIIANATRDTTVAGRTPDLIVANTVDGINDGVLMMRRSKWSDHFLRTWWQNRFSTNTHDDNGAIYSTILEFLAADFGIKYRGECHMLWNPSVATWQGLAVCFQNYVLEKLCQGDRTCLSRVPHSDKTLGTEWQETGRELGKDWEYGWLPRKGQHIAYYSRMNDGLDWKPCAVWSNQSFLLHLAGTRGSQRDELLARYTQQFSSRYSPRCF